MDSTQQNKGSRLVSNSKKSKLQKRSVSRWTICKGWLIEMVIILVAMIFVSVGVNYFRPNGLDFFKRPLSEDAESSLITVRAVSPKEAFKKYQGGKVLFIDARYYEDFLKGHIKGALNLPYHRFDENFDQVVDRLERWDELITYCDGEDCDLGINLADKLRMLGFFRVSYLINGWTVWQEHDYPVELNNGRGRNNIPE